MKTYKKVLGICAAVILAVILIVVLLLVLINPIAKTLVVKAGPM